MRTREREEVATGRRPVRATPKECEKFHPKNKILDQC
jgi:hypothetical protein